MRFVTGQNAALHSRSQAGIKRQLPTGYPPFIPFDLLNYVTHSEKGELTLFLRKSCFFFHYSRLQTGAVSDNQTRYADADCCNKLRCIRRYRGEPTPWSQRAG